MTRGVLHAKGGHSSAASHLGQGFGGRSVVAIVDGVLQLGVLVHRALEHLVRETSGNQSTNGWCGLAEQPKPLRRAHDGKIVWSSERPTQAKHAARNAGGNVLGVRVDHLFWGKQLLFVLLVL